MSICEAFLVKVVCDAKVSLSVARARAWLCDLGVRELTDS